MSVIEIAKTPLEPAQNRKKSGGAIAPSGTDVQKILDTTIKVRNDAHDMGLSFEAYLLQIAVLALTEKLAPRD